MPCFIHFRNGRCQATSRSVIMCGLDRIGTGARRNPSAVKTRTALIPHMKSFRFPHIMCEGTAWLNFPSHVRPSKCGSLSAKALLSCDLSHLRLTLPSECSYKPWFLISWRLPMDHRIEGYVLCIRKVLQDPTCSRGVCSGNTGEPLS